MPRISEVLVADTASLIEVRAAVGREYERRVWSHFSELARQGLLIWPPQVTEELDRGIPDDPALNWIRSHASSCEKKSDLATVREVLRVAPTLVDPDNPREQADPYVIALAMDTVSAGGLFASGVMILTDDRRDKPRKISLASAAGLLHIPSVPIRVYLTSRGLL